jgi:hypothetical protein
MPRAVAAIHGEDVEAFIEDQLARLKPASALESAPTCIADG